MEMTEVFDTLKNLQGVLVEKYDLEKKIEETPKQLVDLEGLVTKLKMEYIDKNSEYESVKNRVSELSDELNEVVKSKENSEKLMDGISSHREFEAVEKQINEAKAKEDELRKLLREEQDRLSGLSTELKDSECFMEDQKAELDNKKTTISNIVNEYNQRLDELKSTEASLSKNLDENYHETIHKFHSIIRRNSEGIVAVRNGVCTGCHMILPAQFANEVRAGESIAFCPYCSRILFYEEPKDGEEEDYSSLDETGSLADFADELDDFGSDGRLESDFGTNYDEEKDDDSFIENDDDSDSDIDDSEYEEESDDVDESENE